MISLSDIRFRTSPCVELKPLAHLSADERERFRDLESDPDCYGLLIPSPPLRTNLKSVERQTADLIASMSTPARLPARALIDDESLADIVDLVLDGILEIESDSGFICGADALPVLCPFDGGPEPSGLIARLSHDALLHAQDLETNDPQTLRAALYGFNFIPISPFWQFRFANREAVLAQVGADSGPVRSLLEREWHTPNNPNGWLNWRPRASAARTADDVTYKLYISPRPERIREAFGAVVRVLSEFPGTPFKLGDSAAGLLRPDKLVAYFPTRELLDEAGNALRRELAGCDAHGVPFTAGLDESGLLCWGVDPPDNDRPLQWLGRESWRLWVVKRLSAAMSIAKTARSVAAAEPWRFAIERARRHGIDVETWTPSATLWNHDEHH